MVNQASNNQETGANKKSVPTAKSSQVGVSPFPVVKQSGTNASFQKMPKGK